MLAAVLFILIIRFINQTRKLLNKQKESKIDNLGDATLMKMQKSNDIDTMRTLEEKKENDFQEIPQ